MIMEIIVIAAGKTPKKMVLADFEASSHHHQNKLRRSALIIAFQYRCNAASLSMGNVPAASSTTATNQNGMQLQIVGGLSLKSRSRLARLHHHNRPLDPSIHDIISKNAEFIKQVRKCDVMGLSLPFYILASASPIIRRGNDVCKANCIAMMNEMDRIHTNRIHFHPNVAHLQLMKLL